MAALVIVSQDYAEVVWSLGFLSLVLCTLQHVLGGEVKSGAVTTVLSSKILCNRAPLLAPSEYRKNSVYRDGRQESRLSGIGVLGGEYVQPLAISRIAALKLASLRKVSRATCADPSWRPTR